MNVLGIELIEHRKPPRIVQQPARDDDFPAEVAASAGDDLLQFVFSFDFLGIFDRREFLVESKLNQRIHSLTIRSFPVGQMLEAKLASSVFTLKSAMINLSLTFHEAC